MPNLIVARHREIIKYTQGKQLVWQHGVIIQHSTYKATARLQVDYHRRNLKLWIQGNEAREYLLILRDEIYSILNAIKGLSLKENVILPEFARINEQRFRLDRDEIEKITYQSLVQQAKAGIEEIFSDAGNKYNLEKVMGFIMTKEQQKKEGVGNTYNATYNIENAGAVGGVGDNHNTIGKIILNSSDKKQISELQEALLTLMKQVQNHDADFEIKVNAYAELKQIQEHLDDLENASPESKSKLQQLLTGVKDGTLGALKLAKGIKESEKTVSWVVEKAIAVSTFLTAIMQGSCTNHLIGSLSHVPCI